MTVLLHAMPALTPTLSPGEREDLSSPFECSPVGDFFQRWNKFSLSHRMGEGRGEGRSCFSMIRLDR